MVRYFVFSAIGNFSFFFFAAHLLDIAVGIKDLGTILRSVTHNGKSLLLTTGFLTIVSQKKRDLLTGNRLTHHR